MSAPEPRPAEPGLGVLIERLRDPDAGERLAAAASLADLGEAALPALDALTVALDDADGEVRLAALHAIALLDPREAEAALAWALQSPDYRVSSTARSLVQGTAKLRGPDSTLWRDPSISHYE